MEDLLKQPDFVHPQSNFPDDVALDQKIFPTSGAFAPTSGFLTNGSQSPSDAYNGHLPPQLNNNLWTCTNEVPINSADDYLKSSQYPGDPGDFENKKQYRSPSPFEALQVNQHDAPTQAFPAPKPILFSCGEYFQSKYSVELEFHDWYGDYQRTEQQKRQEIEREIMERDLVTHFLKLYEQSLINNAESNTDSDINDNYETDETDEEEEDDEFFPEPEGKKPEKKKKKKKKKKRKPKPKKDWGGEDKKDGDGEDKKEEGKKKISDQVHCCLVGCYNAVNNRTRSCMKLPHVMKVEYDNKDFSKICRQCYFSDNYKHKKMCNGKEVKKAKAKQEAETAALKNGTGKFYPGMHKRPREPIKSKQPPSKRRKFSKEP